MAVSNRERVGNALDLLKTGVRPYFEREMRENLGECWSDEAASQVRLLSPRIWSYAENRLC